MAHRQTAHSHPICPTCQSDLTGREKLSYLASDASSPLANDDLYNLHEETSRLVSFVGALAQAAPYAAAAHATALHGEPQWIQYLSWLAEELTEETLRRLECLEEAGGIWKRRAEEKTAGKKEA
jgi:hypothetical protein